MKRGQILKIITVSTVCVLVYVLYVSTMLYRHSSNSIPTSSQHVARIQRRFHTEYPVTTMKTVTLQIKSEDRCEPKKNLFMLKTHKSGSSTLQNILHRYADKHNLTLVLPKFSHQLGYPNKFTRDVVYEVPWNDYNIFAQHSRFNLPEVMKLMPEDTVYITILREPSAQFESLFTYYKLGNHLKIPGENKLEEFLRIPNQYSSRRNSIQRYIQNNYMFDLGFNSDQFVTETKLAKVIEKIDIVFDLVLIAEYFDESLILLRYLMCWDLDSLVYFSLNAREQGSVHYMSDSMRDKISEWNSADDSLYRYFNDTFWQKVELFGERRMEEEIWALKERKQKYWDMCVDDVTLNGKGVWHLPGVNVKSYSLKESAKKNKDCEQMTKPEIPFTHELVSKLKQRITTFRHSDISMDDW